MEPFTNLKRADLIDKLSPNTFDLLVVGGGITGAGIALDAASRGLNVVLAEQNDFASGTSSKSTKLIHGGLRYLKQFDFWLVKEIGSERAILHDLAPHLVVPDKMILPLIQNGNYGSWLTSIGLKIYDILANVEGDDKRQMLDKEEALELEPLLPADLLEGAGFYAEYRTDDARLTIEVIKTAVRQGALAINYAEVKDIQYQDDRVCGAVIHDKVLGKDIAVKASYIVNATGPWVDDVREHMEPNAMRFKRLQLTKGVHLVFPHEKLPVKHSIYFDVPDGRMIFAIPRANITYVGTTDTRFDGAPESAKTELVDVLYLINAVNHMFPDIELTTEDVISSWAGLRPLIYEEGKPVGELSRKDEIFESTTGLISIAGGKLTGYRKMAERVVDLVGKRGKQTGILSMNPIQTEHLSLTEHPFKNYDEVKDYIKETHVEWEPYGFSETDVTVLVQRYGRQTALVFKRFLTYRDADPLLRLAKAELWFGIRYEMVLKPLDFFERRTGRLFFDPIYLERLKDTVLKEFSRYFKWDPSTIDQEKKILEEVISKITKFD